jgi:hypothetical protein
MCQTLLDDNGKILAPRYKTAKYKRSLNDLIIYTLLYINRKLLLSSLD